MSQSPSRIENLNSLRLANINAGFATAFGTLVGGAFLVGFIKERLGGSDLWIGLLTALPLLAGAAQIPGAIIGRGLPGYKRWVSIGGILWRLFYAPLIILPFLPLPNDVRLVIMALCVSVASISVYMSNATWTDYLAAMVPTRSRGWYFGRQSAIATGAGAVVGVAGGALLDWFRTHQLSDTGYAVIFALAFVCGMSSFAFYLGMKDVPREPVKRNLWEGVAAVKAPFQDKRFRAVLIYFVVAVFGQNFGGNLFTAFSIESLGLSMTSIMLNNLMSAVGIVALIGFWGGLADKYGNKPLLVIVGLLVVLAPSMWLFCYPHAQAQSMAILMPGNLFAGFGWGGIAVCQLNLLLSTAKPEDRANYLGAGLTVQACVAGIAPMAGAALMAQLRNAMPPDVAYKAAFGATMFFRLVAVFFLPAVREEGSIPVHEAWVHIKRFTPWGMMAVRNLTHGASPERREEAMRTVAQSGYSLASEEIIRSLHDPSPRVRREAAVALAKLGDSRAVEGLVHQLVEHPGLAEEETIDALGTLRATEAVEVLTQYLKSPRALLRRASARALGHIRASSAIEPLMQAADQEYDPDLRRSALQALRALGAKQAAPVIRKALLEPMASVRIAAAEATAELRVVEAAPELRSSLEAFHDEAASEVAYALGCVGDQSDMDAILKEAAECVSVITRSRCLLGAARLLGVEAKLYPLVLMEEFERDKALLDHLGPAFRRHPVLKEALEVYSEGREAEALAMVAREYELPWTAVMAKRPVQGSFIVAAIALAARR